MNNMIFVVGGIHSGTTLMATILGVNSKCLLIPMESAAYSREHIRTLRKLFVKQVSELDSEFVVEKTPGNIFNIDKMQEDFPEAKFVIMTRNPVDTVASIYKFTKDFNRAVYDCSNYLSACQRAAKLKNTMVVTYEELVKNFDKTMSYVCDFVGIHFEERMKNFHEHSPIWFKRSLSDSEHFRKRSAQMRQPLFDDSGKGYSALSEDEIEQIDFDCMSKYDELYSIMRANRENSMIALKQPKNTKEK